MLKSFAWFGTWWSKEHVRHETCTKHHKKHICVFCGAKRITWFSRIERLTKEVDTLRAEVTNLKQEICIQKWWKHNCLWRDPILWFRGLFCMQPVCPTNLQRDHCHAIITTIIFFWLTLVISSFPRLFLARRSVGLCQSPSWQFVMVHATFLGLSFWFSRFRMNTAPTALRSL